MLYLDGMSWNVLYNFCTYFKLQNKFVSGNIGNNQQKNQTNNNSNSGIKYNQSAGNMKIRVLPNENLSKSQTILPTFYQPIIQQKTQ